MSKKYNVMSNEEKIKLVLKDPFNIRDIKRPSKLLQTLAVSKNPEVIRYIKNPSSEVQICAFNKSEYIIHHLTHVCKELQILIATSEDYDPTLFGLINADDVCDEAEIAFVRRNPENIRLLEDPCEEAQLIAVRANGLLIGEINHIEGTTHDVQLEAVRQNCSAGLLINDYDMELKDDEYQRIELDNNKYLCAVKMPNGEWKYARDTEREYDYGKNKSAEELLDFLEHRCCFGDNTSYIKYLQDIINKTKEGNE